MPPPWPAIAAALPLLGPAGWTRFGVAPPGRDVVAFDVADCGLTVSHLDLDAGPGFRALAVGRVWDGGWVGVGVEALPRGGSLDGPLRVGADEAWVEVRAGEDETRGVNQDGEEVRWRWEGGRLLGFTDRTGMRTTYSYGEDGALTGISWPDGGAVQLAPGRISGAWGTWSCVREAGRSVVSDPSGATWTVTVGDPETVLVDPTGATWRTRREAGRLTGWTDALGRVTRLERDAEGEVVGVEVDGARWSLPAGGVGAYAGPGGRRWSLERDVRGRLVRLVDAVGRVVALDADGAGRVRTVWRGGATRVIGRDRLGRVQSEQLPGSLRVEVGRDERGRVVRVVDPSGATWTVGRGAGGEVTGLVDPVGGAWTLSRDRGGRVVGVVDPRRRTTRVDRRPDGRITRFELEPGGRWELLRGADGALSAIRDAAGHRTGWVRDGVGRVIGVVRADGSTMSIRRDAVGEIVGIEDLRVERDPAGRPRLLDRGDARTIRWEWDPAGDVVGVEAPGVGLRVERAADGAITSVRLRGGEAWSLVRDGAGRVVAVDGPGAVRLRRDGGGRVVEVGWDADDALLRVDRDLRGLPARLRAGDAEWRLRRDAVGRLLGMSAGKGVDLGVDRDAAGRPQVVRFVDGWLARFGYEGTTTSVRLQDGEGSPAGAGSWVEDGAGRLLRRIADAEWVYRRDPLGTLAAAESAAGAWSRAPDRVEGPGGFDARLTSQGRPASVEAGADGPAPYGLGARAVHYVLGTDREVKEVRAGVASVGFTWDGLGRLSGYGGAPVVRDALGGLRTVAGLPVLGFDGLLSVGAEPRASLPGVAWARRGGGLLLDGAGVPLLSVFLGPLGFSPTGRPSGASAAETGAGGRFQVQDGGPLLGLLDAVDPFTGQSLGAGWTWPWSGDTWELPPGSPPWAEPDAAAADVPWDPAPFARRYPDALDLLVAAGEIEGGGGPPEPPGLPWLPASFAPTRPVVVPDPDRVLLDEDPLVELVWAAAHAPVHALAPDDVLRALFAEEIAAELDVPPGLLPPLPSALRP